ncbi:MAG: tetratricopeptide repeat protein, partial [Aurantimonas coralicida]|nr:tetratricopeptide repeat protein [Aurantimonas coralicida]
MRRWVLSFLALVVAAGAALAAGPAAFGRLALSTGLPGWAATLTAEPAVRGVALYRAGRYAEADLAFREAGSEATYNRGVGLAALGRYAEAVAYFDAVLFADPSDAD